jgi:hypothetical protein
VDMLAMQTKQQPAGDGFALLPSVRSESLE